MRIFDVSERSWIARQWIFLLIDRANRLSGGAMKYATLKFRRLQARQAFNRLLRMDDRQLKDIGLGRRDLDWALMQDEYADPTEALQHRRLERLNCRRTEARRLTGAARSRETR